MHLALDSSVLAAKVDKPSILRGPSEPSLVAWTFNDLLARQSIKGPTEIVVISR